MTAPTRADLYEYLKQVPQTTANDTLLDKLLVRAGGLVNAFMRTRLRRRWTGWQTAWPAASAQLVYAWGTNTLYLQPHQLGSVTAVQQGGAYVSTQAWVEDAYSGDLLLLSRNPWFTGDPRYAGETSWGRGPYQVTAKWGFGPMPDEVAQVILEVAVNTWRGRDRGMWTDQVNGMGGQYLRYVGGMTKQQEMVLASVADLWRVRSGTLEAGVEGPRYRTTGYEDRDAGY
jgi:hypothetical protein